MKKKSIYKISSPDDLTENSVFLVSLAKLPKKLVK